MGTTENILGYDVQTAGATACVQQVLTAMDRKKSGSPGVWLACINPHTYVEASRDSRSREALKGADWLIPDGYGIVIASRVLGGNIRDRVTGNDIFVGVMDAMNHQGRRHVFFLGSTEQTLTRIKEKAAKDYPNISISSFSPPFKAEYETHELNEMVDRINSAKPDVLWVGLTAPKQERLLNAIIDRIDVRFAGAIGAVFDFYTGGVRRSHPAFQRAGLEWLPRLLREPRRLWRRTFVSAPVFMWHVLGCKLRGPKQSDAS